MMADTTLYSKYDIAALMALINMLKVSLIDQPEVYKTLLAMMCDFDPREANLRNKIIRYMKLMIKDHMLVRCLLMSLPEGLSSIPRAVPVHSPAPERIFLPQKLPKSPVKGTKVKHRSVKLKRLTQLMPKKLLKAPTTSTISSAAEFLSAGSHGIQPDESSYTPLKAQPSLQFKKEFHTDSIKKETTDKSVSQAMVCGAPASKHSITEILRMSDDPRQVLVNIVGTTGLESSHQGQSQGHYVPQQFITSGISSTASQRHGLPYPQQLPGLVRLQAGMTVRPVLPWRPINLIQPSVVRQNLSSSLSHTDTLMNETKTGTDLTTSTVKAIVNTEEIFTTQSSTLVSESRGKVAAVTPIRKQHEAIKTVTRQSCSSQTLPHENMDKSNDISVQNVAPLHPGGVVTGSLQALAELTSRISDDTKHRTDTRICLGARKSASTGSLPRIDDIKKETSAAPKAPLAILTASPSITRAPQSTHNFIKNASRTSKATGQENGNTMVKSFPYRQEIQLLDGKYFLLNSSADKKILSLRSDKKLSHPTITRSLQAPLLHNLTAGTSQTDPTHHINTQSVKLHTELEINDLSKTGQNGNCYSTHGVPTQTEDMNRPPNSTCAYTISHKSGEEKTCTFHVSNSTTNRLVTELLRKRALSDCTHSICSPSKKQVRTKSESQAPDQDGQTGIHVHMSVNNFDGKASDATKTIDEFDRQHMDDKHVTLQDKNDSSVETTVTNCEDEKLEVGNALANQISANANTTDAIACNDTEVSHFKLMQNNLEKAHRMLELKLMKTSLQQSLIKMGFSDVSEGTDISGLEEDQSVADITSTDIDSDSSDFDDFCDDVFIN